MSARHVAAGVVGVGGLVVALALLAVPRTSPEARLEVPGATPAVLDTIAVRGRIVEASLDARVVEIAPTGDVWLSAGGDAIRARFGGDAAFEVEDRVLVVGRLRARGGQRWLDVSAWAVVEADVRAPSGPGL